MNYANRFMVKPGKKIHLSRIDPDDTAGIKSKEAAQARLKENLDRLTRLQYRLYAENRRSLLIVLQGMDAAGKDGTIRHVMGGINPQGCSVTSFKQPSKDELDHDFLWRIHRAVPAKGDIGIFNRSHYEDVLVVRVHGLVPEEVWSARYDQINQFERILTQSGITLLKFFLHIGKDEQRRRIRERLNDPSKNWKFTPEDVGERKYWDDYVAAYEDALRCCSTPWAPWYVIPANCKWFRNLAISTIIMKTLETMDPNIPKASRSLAHIRIP